MQGTRGKKRTGTRNAFSYYASRIWYLLQMLYTRSTIIAIPCPTPMHMVQSA